MFNRMASLGKPLNTFGTQQDDAQECMKIKDHEVLGMKRLPNFGIYGTRLSLGTLYRFLLQMARAHWRLPMQDFLE